MNWRLGGSDDLSIDQKNGVKLNVPRRSLELTLLS